MEPIAYAELHCLSNFSFLRGASHPWELVQRAAELGYTALAITDRNSLAGVVRAHVAAKELEERHKRDAGAGFDRQEGDGETKGRRGEGAIRNPESGIQHPPRLIIGAEITPVDAPPIVLLAPDRRAYANLCRLITRGRLRCRKGECEIRLADIAELGKGWIGIVVPEGCEGQAQPCPDVSPRRRDADAHPDRRDAAAPLLYRRLFPAGDLFLAAALVCDVPDAERLEQLAALSEQTGIPLVACNHVHYHVPARRYLQDVLTCIREKCTLAGAGRRLLPNAERHLRPREEIERRYTRHADGRLVAIGRAAVRRTVEIARRCTFSLDELRYEYPHELVPEGMTAMEFLEQLTWEAAARKHAAATERGRGEGTQCRRPDERAQRRTEAGAQREGLDVVLRSKPFRAPEPAGIPELAANGAQGAGGNPDAGAADRAIAAHICSYGFRRSAGSGELCTSGSDPQPPEQGGVVPACGSASRPLRHAVSSSIPPHIRTLLTSELALIRELRYEHYFLTVWDLCRFARSRGILCQGRGSAANSAVCYYLGITAVDPTKHDLLFERFISRERNEPPDIDVDFEHERREEVFQYIYNKYGRERAGITAEVIRYRPRSAIRDVAKVFGLSLDRIDVLARSVEWFDGWTDLGAAPPESGGGCAAVRDGGQDARTAPGRGAACGQAARAGGAKSWPQTVPAGESPVRRALRRAGLDPADRTVRMIVKLVRELLGFPRHLSQHVGGFVITQTPLCEIVPLENGAMPDRTFIQWDKDDIDALGILKVDCLALGMLTALSKCLSLLRRGPQRSGIPVPRFLHDIPDSDPAVYEMIGRADTIGVFQIESRAQMSMLPRLRPRNFYDLVIEVAIVRPGPIQGGMVHPYLRRRDGREPVTYPNDAVRKVLYKTLGVPLFQEQVMRLAVVAAGFTPGEADQLRRAMAAWRRDGQIEQFQTQLLRGMLANGYSRQFAEQIYRQIQGFGEYGFPESHAASFALLVYASAWLKRYHPAAFCAAMLNSQPLGFYTPGQLIRDAIEHGVEVRPVDVNYSEWDCVLEERNPEIPGSFDRSIPSNWGRNGPALRLGLRLVRGLSAARVQPIVAIRERARAREENGNARRREGDCGGQPLSLPRQTLAASIPPSRDSSPAVTSIHQLARAGVLRDTLLRLAAADAFRSLGLSRRQAVWQILALDGRSDAGTDGPRDPESGRPNATPFSPRTSVRSSLLFDDLEPGEPPVALPEMPLEETVLHDYDALGFSLNAHPIGLVRAELSTLRLGYSRAAPRIIPSAQLRHMRHGQRVAVAGLVTCRQRPGTAKGIVFITLEDETGMANLIVRPDVWDRDRDVAGGKIAVIAEGRVEREGEVIHINAQRLHDLSAHVLAVRSRSRDFH